MTLRGFWRPGVAVVAVGLLAACGGDGGAGPPAGTSAEMDSPDFTINPELESRWVVGALDGEDWEVFGAITDLAFNEAGDLFILDEQAGHVVVLDRAGAHLRTISRQGEGPGELTDPRSMALLADGRLAVFDRSRRGIQFFTQEGEYLESAPFDPQRGMPNFVRAWLPDGSILTDIETRITGTAEGAMSVSSGPVGGELERPIIQYGPDGSRAVRYTAWDPPPPTGEGASTEGAVRFTMSPIRAFDPSLSFVPLPDGRLAVVDSVDYRIKLVATAGTVDGVLERPVSPIPVTGAIREAERERRLEQLGGRVRVSSALGGSVPLPGDFQEQMAAARRTMIEQMTFANAIPAIDALAVDFEGRLWVERRGLPGQEGPIDIVTPDARYLGTIQPDGLQIPGYVRPGRPHGLRGDARSGLSGRARHANGPRIPAEGLKLNPDSPILVVEGGCDSRRGRRTVTPGALSTSKAWSPGLRSPPPFAMWQSRIWEDSRRVRATRKHSSRTSQGIAFRLSLWTIALTVAANGVSGPISVAAQETVRVAGVVTDDGTGAPVEGAVVRLADPSGSVRETMTNPEGAFAFEAVSPGAYVLGVRRIGYEVLSIPLEVGPDAQSLDVRIRPQAIPLDPLEVDVEGRPPRLSKPASTSAWRRDGGRTSSPIGSRRTRPGSRG